MSESASKECKTIMIVIEMDISHLMNYAEQIEEKNLTKHPKESKRDRVKGGGFSHERVGAHG